MKKTPMDCISQTRWHGGLLKPHLTAGSSGGLAVCILPGAMRADELVKTKDSPNVSSPVLAIGRPL